MTPNPNPGLVQGTPLISDLAQDPDMRELVEMFVDEMPARVRSLQHLWDSRDFESLKRLAHQLKGASGGYGFTVVGGAAGRLEQTIKASSASGTLDDHLANVQSQVNELINLCRRVSR
jgi:HPt (histidine-containing phosphotransfer) domain-containing protein